MPTVLIDNLKPNEREKFIVRKKAVYRVHGKRADSFHTRSDWNRFYEPTITAKLIWPVVNDRLTHIVGCSVNAGPDSGLEPNQGEVLVTGATGGVGSVAVDILSKRGYEVVASTGKETEHDFLRRLGAKRIINRDEINEAEQVPMREERWAGVVDCVGGTTLQYILSTLKLNGSVATSGATGGMDVTTTLHPFISRGVNWLEVDSVTCPMNIREKIWKRLGSDLKPKCLNEIVANELSLAKTPGFFDKILAGKIRGRLIIKM